MRRLYCCLVAVILVAALVAGCGLGRTKTIIVHDTDAAPMEILAAREIQRYIYLRTGELLTISPDSPDLPKRANRILVGAKSRALIRNSAAGGGLGSILDILVPGHAFLRTITQEKPHRTILIVTGGDLQGTLYAAYRLAEAWGVRFSLSGDIIPDEPIPFALPDVNSDFRPQFATRGIRLSYGFPEGPDWWTVEDYKAVLGQLPKLGMNMFLLKSGASGDEDADPLTWIGMKEDIGTNGAVNWAYPSRWFSNLMRTNGFIPKETSDFSWGASVLFSEDDHGASTIPGHIPLTDSGAGAYTTFTSAGTLLTDVFAYAHSLGVSTGIGATTPLIIPKALQERLRAQGNNPGDPAILQRLYEGMFTRFSALGNLDYYWLDTMESGSRGGDSEADYATAYRDITAALAAAETVQAPFTLAVGAWKFGPQSNGARFHASLPDTLPLGAIRRYSSGAPADSSLKTIERRPTWTFPWIEDDANLTMPQLWAGRIQSDAMYALDYGCTGIVGIHRRTGVIDPTLASLVSAAWAPSQNRNRNVDEFYTEWAKSRFGESAATDISSIFQSIDSRLPSPSRWVNGPGSLFPDNRPWEEVKSHYDFVGRFEALRPAITGASAIGRFDYWLATFNYLMTAAHLNCAWGEFERIMITIAAERNPSARATLARDQALPAYRAMVLLTGELYGYLLATVSTPGELGTIANLETNTLPQLLGDTGKRLSAALDEPLLPADTKPSTTFEGAPRLIVPTVRTSLGNAESLRIEAIVLDGEAAKSVTLSWRLMGKGEYHTASFFPVARGVWRVEVPATSLVDEPIEYYLSAVTSGGESLVFPATAPGIAQTVVMIPTN